ncbi:MAG: hypothetical protein ACXADL_01110 [Candidatus Thorarchaeota archaeon]|jgi:hypothetical protein
MSDLILLLKQDLAQTLRIRNPKGRRSERRSFLRRSIRVVAVVLVFIVIVFAIVSLAPLFWTDIESFVLENLGIASTIFNAILLFSFIGSIMVSANTVGNSSRMEYLMTMPISLRTIFLEKTIIIIFYNAMLWLIIGTPIFIGFSFVSTAAFALLSVPVFVGLLLILVTLGVSIGGLLGLLFARLLAGRRRLKQIGYAILTAGGIFAGVFWYASFYLGGEGFQFFNVIIEIANALGFGSDITPGYAVSVISLGLLVGAPLTIQQFISPLIYLGLGFVLVYVNSIVSEEAHYSGWMASGSKRTSKTEIVRPHSGWNPQSIPGFRFNSTISVSIWYNISSIKREARVFTNYLLGPFRFIFFLFIPIFMPGAGLTGLTPYFAIAALIPFATSYGLYFAGYETVYEGKNLMNLQLAAANMQDYLKGKVYSAVPFTLVASGVMSVIVLFIAPSIWIYLPAVIIGCAFVTMASGAIAANAAAIGGDFKAERNITRQRGSAVQMPIRGWSILRAQLIPYAVAYGGIFGMIGAGMFLTPLLSYIILPVFAVVCLQLLRHYTFSAGVRLAQIEADKYL